MGTMAKRRTAAAATVLFLILYLMQMLVTAAPARAASVTPVPIGGNENCAAAIGTDQILKLEGADLATGTYLATNGDSITVTIFDDATFNWSSTGLIAAVFVKGGPDGNLYDYSPDGAYSDTGLHAPVNPNNVEYYGLSHITFCEFIAPPSTTTTVPEETTTTVAETTTTTVPQTTTTVAETTTSTTSTTTTTLPPEQPSATVTSECIPGGGTKITVDVENGAMVRIDGPGEDDPVFAADNSIVVDWPVGSYDWGAWIILGERGELFDEGSIEVVSCTTPPPPSSTTTTTTQGVTTVSASVTGECDTDVVTGEGFARVIVDVEVPGSVTVVITGVGSFTNDAGVGRLPDQAAYAWTITPDPGYAITGLTQGTVNVGSCDVEVLGTVIESTTTVAEVSAETLPFTGFEFERTLGLAIATLMVGAGLLLVAYGAPERKVSTIADRW